ncbi:hypothetical protein [Aquilutibacter rugosus]|uniref:hypothetical protein n=1 Tax=Aquilutibacter rugosus TaxID=3115820 RepID=UPI002F3F2506
MNIEIILDVFADHFQVLMGDSVRAPLVDTTALWDLPGRLGTLKGCSEIVGLGTIRYGGKTGITVRVGDHQELPSPDWLLLGKFDLDVPSGRLIFWGPEIETTVSAPGVDLSPGGYEGTAFSRGEQNVHDEMDSEGPDEYLIVLSPSGQLQR